MGTAQLRSGAVTAAKIRSHSLSAGVLAAGVLRAAVVRTNVVQGLVNPVPPCGASGCVASPVGTAVQVPAAACSRGEHVTGGGYVVSAGETVTSSEPTSDDGGWVITVVLSAPTVIGPDAHATAVCG